MKLPNAERAIADIRKLHHYCLDPANPKGRNKARVFAAALGLTRNDAEFLRRRLLIAICNEPCTPSEADDYGQRYTVDFNLETATGSRLVRSGWIVRHNEDFPRLTTCFIVKSK
ncbi:MAG: DUF6883 domain-containing protein [Limisphaerales bacterium]